ncbi:MAG: hypothetical protein HGA31_05660 [Candidatus Moranbacteria bacterium]|nr:hypothetical protein [Candidatus Moranbacteria bacterium]
MDKKAKKISHGRKDQRVRQAQDRFIEEVPPCLGNDPLVAPTMKRTRNSSDETDESDPMTS